MKEEICKICGYKNKQKKEWKGLCWQCHTDKDSPTQEELEVAWVEAQQVADADAAAKTNRLVSTKTKLEALGLTVDEIKDAFGI